MALRDNLEQNGTVLILVIEDEEAMRDLLFTLLRRQGYQVRLAADGEHGFAMAMDPSVALVLLDVMLPDEDGFHVCLKIKEHRPALPIIILTVRDKAIDVVEGLDRGADDYVTKPFSSPVLLARVRAALRSRQVYRDRMHKLGQSEMNTLVWKTMSQLLAPLGRLLHPYAVVDTVVEQLKAALAIDHCAVCLWNREPQGVRRIYQSTSGPEMASVLGRLDETWDAAFYDLLLKQDQMVIFDAFMADSSPLEFFRERLGASAGIAAPLLDLDKLLGVVLLFSCERPTWEMNDLDLVFLLSCQIGLVLRHLYLLSERVDLLQLQQSPELVADVAHELRAPVAVIKGFITTLLSHHRAWDDDEREEFLNSVNQGVDRLSRLIENVLEMSRVDRGGQLHKRHVQLLPIVERLIRDLSFQPTLCEFVNQIAADLPPLLVDPLKIERVLRNLLENAVKFSPQGGQIRVFADVRAGQMLIGVSDEGIGIPPDYLDRVFERFFQVEQDQVPQEGIGLGLAVVKELVQAHGGQVWAESQPGQGTTVYLTLPLQDVYAASSPHAHAQRLGRSGGNLTDRPKILLVEDDVSLSLRLKAELTACGYEVLTTAYGQEAIEQARQTLALILLDLSLPDCDGLDVCEQIRQFSDVPIIITGRQNHQVRGLELGADDYLIKPFTPDELLARIQAVLRRAYAPESEMPAQPLRFNDLEIDPLSREVKTPRGVILLTPTEHKLLYCLASNVGQTLTHQQLLSKVWGYDCDLAPQYLWVNISRLRKKIEQDPRHPVYILTEPGVGYRFAAR